MEKTKKLINNVQDCVDDNLEGIVAVNPGLRKLEGYRVLVRSDLDAYSASGKVAILSGGGSGHEPAFAGYVGQGMCTGAVLGAIFASPSSKVVLAAIRVLAKNNPAGVLMMYNNYTGDRIHFGIALERARAEGIKITQLTNAEDCALVTSDKSAGRRGLAALLFMLKVAGQLAEEGRSLEEIAELTKQVGASVGSGPLFSVAADEMELGLGLHGEAGVQTVKMKTARETVALMLDHMTNPGNKVHFRLQEGDDLALMVNNFGSLSDLEVNIMAREAILYLESHAKVKVSRVYVGRFVTSQEMAGVSLSLMQLNNDMKGYLDAECKAYAWSPPVLHNGQYERSPLGDVPYTEDKSVATISCPSVQYGASVKAVLSEICKSLLAAEERLNQLDAGSGDGDCGSSMREGTQRLLEGLEAGEEELTVSKPCQLLLQMAALLEESMGGSSGGLYSVFLTAASSPLRHAVTIDSYRQAFKAGIDAIKSCGGAEPGDRTMLDPLHAAYKVWEEKHADTQDYKLILADMAQAARRTAEATAGMSAGAGRASYVSKEHLTAPDPGAMAVALWMQAIHTTLC